MFRCSNKKVGRFWRIERWFRSSLQSENVSRVRSTLCEMPYITKAAVLSLLDPKHFLLPLLGGRFPFESAVGLNGRVWVCAKEIRQTIAMARCIEAVDPDGGTLKDAKSVRAFLDTLDI